jgi:hypothetical protein
MTVIHRLNQGGSYGDVDVIGSDIDKDVGLQIEVIFTADEVAAANAMLQ